MKTTDSMIRGSLRPQAYGPLANYFLRFLQAYDSAGVAVQYITVQNEPRYEPGDYPGTLMPAAERAAFIGRYLGPLLQQNRVATGILDWDHNWDMTDEPQGVLADPTANPFVAGVAWHCYAGNVSAQSAVHDLQPSKDVFLTECSGGSWQAGGFAGALGSMVGDLIIDGTRNWARGVDFWSLALDPANGPHAGGCGTCRGVVTIDPATGAVTRNAEYYALGHASRFVRQGAVRVGSNSDTGGLKSVAFQNPDGSKVLLVLNGASAERTFAVRVGSRSFQSTLPAGAVATYQWS
jgi:glucosylceramidase